MESEFRKKTTGKLRVLLLPMDAVARVIRVLEHGAQKYGDNNWRSAGSSDVFIEAALRHLMKHIAGERYDDESGLPHLSHAGASIILAIAMSIKEYKDGSEEQKEGSNGGT
jgi:hypothetical protein